MNRATQLISTNQWADLEKELTGSFASASFKYEDIDIVIYRERYNEQKTVLAVYINGKINFGAGWPNSEHFNPLVKDIWRKRSRKYHSKKEQRRLIKVFGKRKVKEHFPNLEAAQEWYEPFFNSAKSLVAQFKKIDGIEIQSNEDSTVAVGL